MCIRDRSLADAKEGERFQFVRMGYYCKDRESGRFNRIVTLKDSFAKTLKMCIRDRTGDCTFEFLGEKKGYTYAE